jgi:hypothetical protein
MQADDHFHAMSQAAHLRANPSSDSPSISFSEARRRVLECASLAYNHAEVTLPATLHALQRNSLSFEQQKKIWNRFLPKELLQRIQDAVQVQEGEPPDSKRAVCTAAQLLTEHFMNLEAQIRTSMQPASLHCQ